MQTCLCGGECVIMQLLMCVTNYQCRLSASSTVNHCGYSSYKLEPRIRLTAPGIRRDVSTSKHQLEFWGSPNSLTIPGHVEVEVVVSVQVGPLASSKSFSRIKQSSEPWCVVGFINIVQIVCCTRWCLLVHRFLSSYADHSSQLFCFTAGTVISCDGDSIQNHRSKPTADTAVQVVTEVFFITVCITGASWFTLVWRGCRPARGFIKVVVAKLAFACRTLSLLTVDVHSAARPTSARVRAVDKTEIWTAYFSIQTITIFVTAACIRTLTNTSSTVIVNHAFYARTVVGADGFIRICAVRVKKAFYTSVWVGADRSRAIRTVSIQQAFEANVGKFVTDAIGALYVGFTFYTHVWIWADWSHGAVRAIRVSQALKANVGWNLAHSIRTLHVCLTFYTHARVWTDRPNSAVHAVKVTQALETSVAWNLANSIRTLVVILTLNTCV